MKIEFRKLRELGELDYSYVEHFESSLEVSKKEREFYIKLPELLKAIELKLKYKEEKPEDIEKKIEEILNGDRKEV